MELFFRFGATPHPDNIPITPLSSISSTCIFWNYIYMYLFNGVWEIFYIQSKMRILLAFPCKGLKFFQYERLIYRFLGICPIGNQIHYSDVIMGAKAPQITSLTIVYSIVYSGADKWKHQRSVSLAFVRGIHRWPAIFGKIGHKFLESNRASRCCNCKTEVSW